MKNSKLFLRVTLALFLLVGCGTFITQSSSAGAFDCESERWTAFINANSAYNGPFRAYHHDDPNSCSQECQNTCSTNNDPNCQSQCVSQCNSTRLSALHAAQDAIVAAGNRYCPPQLDVCGEARWRESLCSNTRSNRLSDPVYDPNQKGQVLDGEWFSDVNEEYMACRAASGVDNCE